MLKKSIIYCYTNKLNGKSYVGQTVNPGDRKAAHIRDAMRNGSELHFHRALRKYGVDAFEYNILETELSPENVDAAEIRWIAEYDSYYNGYNETKGGKGRKDVKHRQDSIEKMKGRTFTEEQRKAIGDRTRGLVKSDDVRAKLSKRVIQMDLNGIFIAEYFGANEAARQTKSNFSKICAVCRGERKQHNGFKWSYK